MANEAAHGAGLYYLGYGEATIEECLFAANEAIYEGGALALDTGSAQVRACIFEDNVAGWSGGAVFLHPGEQRHSITDCQFIANIALGQGLDTGGGAIGDRGSETTISRCLFQGNRAFGDIDELAGFGGAVRCDGVNTNLANCTFGANYANVGNAVACVKYVEDANAVATNCIFWDGGNELWIGPDSRLAVSYSNLREDAQSDTADDYLDPLFASPGYWIDPGDPNLLLGPQDPGALWVAGDYHLMSREGHWDPIQETWIVDDSTSPCIDAGDPNSPWYEEPEPNGGRINLGVYGGTSQASKSAASFLTTSSSSGGLVSTPGEGQFEYETGEEVTVEALADLCYDFVGWSGTAVEAGKVDDVNAASTTVIVDSDYTLIANFSLRQVSVTLSSGEGGSVQTPGEGEFDCDCGALVPVQAVADDHYYFTHWSGTAVGAGKVTDPANPNTTVEMDADYTLTANFAIEQHILEISSVGGGLVYIMAIGNGSVKQGIGDRTYTLDYGTEVLILTIPMPGYTFQNFVNSSGSFYSTTECWEFTLEKDIDLKATFILEPNP